LTAGPGITIASDTISIGLSIGPGLSLSSNTLSSTIIQPTAGTGISISSNTISSTIVQPTAGTGITIVSNTISASASAIPAGTLIAFAGAACPDGYTAADGTAKSISGTYASLWAAVGITWGATISGNFYVPDMRGVFPKGSGTTARAVGKDASGNYYAATLGTYYTDKMQGHYHYKDPANKSEYYMTTTAGGVSNVAGTQELLTGNSTGDPQADATNGTTRTGHTTEPQSAGVLYCIKY
jgi:microcystin-dependent protein